MGSNDVERGRPRVQRLYIICAWCAPNWQSYKPETTKFTGLIYLLTLLYRNRREKGPWYLDTGSTVGWRNRKPAVVVVPPLHRRRSNGNGVRHPENIVTKIFIDQKKVRWPTIEKKENASLEHWTTWELERDWSKQVVVVVRVVQYGKSRATKRPLQYRRQPKNGEGTYYVRHERYSIE